MDTIDADDTNDDEDVCPICGQEYANKYIKTSSTERIRVRSDAMRCTRQSRSTADKYIYVHLD